MHKKIKNDTRKEPHALPTAISFKRRFFTKREYYGRIFDRITSASPFRRNGDRVCQRYGKIRNAAHRQQLESPPRQIYLRAAEYQGERKREREKPCPIAQNILVIFQERRKTRRRIQQKIRRRQNKKSPRSNARAPLHTKIFFKVKILKPTRPHGRANIFLRVGIVGGAQILAVPNYGSARL